MKWDERIIWCVGCGIEIPWSAIIKDSRIYCCEDCLEGKPCSCAESLELDVDIRLKPESMNGFF